MTGTCHSDEDITVASLLNCAQSLSTGLALGTHSWSCEGRLKGERGSEEKGKANSIRRVRGEQTLGEDFLA